MKPLEFPEYRCPWDHMPNEGTGNEIKSRRRPTDPRIIHTWALNLDSWYLFYEIGKA